jgi:hypothetical protein
MGLGQRGDIGLLAARRLLLAAADAAELASAAFIGGISAKPPRTRIAASSVSCGERPSVTSLALGGRPLL